MSIFASILRAVYRLSGAKKAFALPEDALRKEIEKQNRHRGVFTPTDRKAYYETIAVNGFPCLIVRWHPKPSERAIPVSYTHLELPFEAEQFDVVTAFETVYFWPELAQNFREVYRVLKPGGTFFICNEANGETAKDDKWTQIINGMTIYTDADLKVYLEQAGFGRVQSHKNKKGWLCVTARK